MFNSQFIEVGIGLVFVYLLMSIMVSAVNEAFVSFRSHRGKELKDALTLALDDNQNKNWVELIYDHPLIDTLKKSEKRPPSYISAASFATSLIEVISNEAIKDSYKVSGENITYESVPSNSSPLENFKEGLGKLKHSDTKILLQSFVNNSDNNYDTLKLNIENWFNEYMDRVTGWYKKKAVRRLRVIAVILTIIMNVNTIDVSTALWTNAVLRESVVATAENFAKQNSTLPNSKKDTTLEQQVSHIKGLYKDMGMLNLPIGWEDQNKKIDTLRKNYGDNKSAIKGRKDIGSIKKWFLKIFLWKNYAWDFLGIYFSQIGIKRLLGWLFTAIAISFGAPFWFDMLNKLINLRNAGKQSTPQKSESSTAKK